MRLILQRTFCRWRVAQGYPSVALAVAAVGLALVCHDTRAQTLDGACPISQSRSPRQYTRLHQIPTTPRPDDVSHKVVTPGGMVLETPKMVGATDVLTVRARDSNVLCFSLLTVGRDRHTCKLAGIALVESDGAYLFREDDVAVRFAFSGADQVIVEPLGMGYRRRCEPSGKIERATYEVDMESRR